MNMKNILLYVVLAAVALMVVGALMPGDPTGRDSYAPTGDRYTQDSGGDEEPRQAFVPPESAEEISNDDPLANSPRGTEAEYDSGRFFLFTYPGEMLPREIQVGETGGRSSVVMINGKIPFQLGNVASDVCLGFGGEFQGVRSAHLLAAAHPGATMVTKLEYPREEPLPVDGSVYWSQDYTIVDRDGERTITLQAIEMRAEQNILNVCVEGGSIYALTIEYW